MTVQRFAKALGLLGIASAVVLVALQFYFGGVVIDTKIEADRHLVILRDTDQWRETHMVLYWAEYFADKLMLALAIGAVLLWAGIWVSRSD